MLPTTSAWECQGLFSREQACLRGGFFLTGPVCVGTAPGTWLVGGGGQVVVGDMVASEVPFLWVLQ